ncbi:MAG: hypothetical protein M0Z99_00750 [Betaproteobacteria bacterium]|nr:hypothetical protein [Betaproteobacteria bacterium]
MSTIENAKKAMGWKHANQRERCATCAHRDMSGSPSAPLREPVRCKKGGFITSAFSVCDQWKERL